MFKRFKCKLPMNLQTFAEGGTGDGSAAGSTGSKDGTPPAGSQTPQFDYDKLASLIAGKQTVTEETVLKDYFKQQGLSKEQMDQAIAAFKQQQAVNTPDVAGLQNQITETQNQLTAAQTAVQQAQVESAATMMAVTLGIDAKTIPYVLKMADLSQVIGQDGKINDETLKNAVNKVLEDIPALKPQADGKTGFTQIGTGGNPAQHSPQAGNSAAVPTKRWNRFNN
nr:MAG TPA: Major head protein [Caudoviricetes sp.]